MPSSVVSSSLTRRSRKTAFAAFALAFAFASALSATRVQAATSGHSIDSHTWHDRLLIVFAPNEASTPLNDQREIAKRAQASFSDRQLVKVEVIGDSVNGSSDSAAVLRQRYGVSRNAFRALLVGKDGGVKLSVPRPLNAQELTETIDAMPMRREEAARPKAAN